MTIDPARDLLLMEDAIWVLAQDTGIAIYDFQFDRFLPHRRPWQRPPVIEAVARVGAIEDYDALYQSLMRDGIQLVHSPTMYRRCSELDQWYPLLQDITPKSISFDRAPEASEIAARFGWPVFLKGSRQTSRHRRALSIVRDAESFARAMAAYQQDPILRWQKIVCRQYVPLRPVEDTDPDRIPSSFEFRTFWWRGELAGFGRYWWEGKPYGMNETEKEGALSVAREAARRIGAVFLVVDVAQTVEGRWIVIECNDGQESGYAGASPLGIWQNIVEIERLSRLN
jgi:hypothetical protein